MRDDWDLIKDDVMYEVCLSKFLKNPILLQKLIDTGNEELVEGNTWGDRYWGVCDGVGKNHLGKILMRLRDEFKEPGHVVKNFKMFIGEDQFFEAPVAVVKNNINRKKEN